MSCRKKSKQRSKSVVAVEAAAATNESLRYVRLVDEAKNLMARPSTEYNEGNVWFLKNVYQDLRSAYQQATDSDMTAVISQTMTEVADKVCHYSILKQAASQPSATSPNIVTIPKSNSTSSNIVTAPTWNSSSPQVDVLPNTQTSLTSAIPNDHVEVIEQTRTVQVTSDADTLDKVINSSTQEQFYDTIEPRQHPDESDALKTCHTQSCDTPPILMCSPTQEGQVLATNETTGAVLVQPSMNEASAQADPNDDDIVHMEAELPSNVARRTTKPEPTSGDCVGKLEPIRMARPSRIGAKDGFPYDPGGHVLTRDR